MLLPEILRWTAVAAVAAAAFRLHRPVAFWSLTAGRPFVLTRNTAGPGPFRSAVPT